MHPNTQKRQQILEVLYQEREAQAGKLKESWTTEADLKNAVGDIDFGLSVLIEIGHVKRDGYLLRITGAGVLACEIGQSA